MFQSHQKETRFPVIWNYLHHCLLLFWIIKASYVLHMKYGITQDLNHNSNLTTKKIPFSGEDKLKNGQRLLGS